MTIICNYEIVKRLWELGDVFCSLCGCEGAQFVWKSTLSGKLIGWCGCCPLPRMDGG